MSVDNFCTSWGTRNNTVQALEQVSLESVMCGVGV